MKRSILSGLAISGLLIVAPLSVAGAADMPVKAPPASVVAPAISWTGFYIGGDVGYGWGRSTGVLNDGFFNTAPVPYSADPTGVIGGGFAGYNYQINQLVVGVEADWQDANLSGSGSGTCCGGLSYTMNTKVPNYGSVRGRLGFVQGRWLVFATGGWAWGDAQTSYASTGFAPFHTNKFDGSGGTAGAGVEYAITNNWLARVEYRYTDLGSHSFEIPAACGCGENGNRISINDIRLGLAYKL
jgi:outer membrane immunogenic protein